jgi:hypothetical protein
MNIESANFKPNPINSCSHNIRVCFQQQLRINIETNLGKVNRHVWFEDPHGLEDHIL